MSINQFGGCYEGTTVLLTGDSGFKGSWLAIWLQRLGAKVIGYSLPPLAPSLFELADLKTKIDHIDGDLNDLRQLKETLSYYRPEIVFHLAAQAIVLQGYEDPVDTFSTNALGTVNLLEAVRGCPDVKAVVVVTTDKCYENREWCWGYRESDALGGHDPYSASKAMAELAVASYRRSFFQDTPAVATARAGNVIGGGDFSSYRILPDAMKALMAQQAIQVRNPASIRPWMHVLDPLSGYLWLGACLLEKGQPFAQAWNFGPLEQQGVSVETLVEKAIDLWEAGEWVDVSDAKSKPEMSMLRLNWDKAAHQLYWKPTYGWEEAVTETVDWFKGYASKRNVYKMTLQHIEQYCAKSSALWSSAPSRMLTS